MNLKELLDTINEEKASVIALADAGKLDEAEETKKSLVEHQRQFDLLKDMESGNADPIDTVPAESPRDAVHDFAEAARHRFKNLDEVTPNKEETGEAGGYAVPQDIQTRINEHREASFELRDLVSVETVTAPTGARTYLKKTQHKGFETVAEAAKIGGAAAPAFERVEYKIEKRGGYLPVTNELLADSDTNISNLLIDWLGREATATDNANIVKLASNGFTKVEDVASVDKIKEIVNVKLGQAYADNATIVTNDDGLQWLDTLKDKTDRYLLSMDVNAESPFSMRLAVGRRTIPVVVVPNSVMASGEDGKIPFIIGDLKEAIRIFDRQLITIKTSDTASMGTFNAFEQDMTLFRATLRADYKIMDKDAAVYATVNGSPK